MRTFRHTNRLCQGHRERMSPKASPETVTSKRAHTIVAQTKLRVAQAHATGGGGCSSIDVAATKCGPTWKPRKVGPPPPHDGRDRTWPTRCTKSLRRQYLTGKKPTTVPK